MSKMIDMTGQKYGEWTVIERDMSKLGKTAAWICECSCGTRRSVSGPSLRRGVSQSCGCQKKIKARENNGTFVDETGNRYGKLLVIAKDEGLSIQKHRAQWICKCDCGNFKTVSSKCLRDGKTHSCGCLVSIGESNIQKILEDNNIIFISQYGVWIKDRYYRFDFAILNEDLEVKRLIEFDGIQHTDASQLHWGKNNEQIQQRDKIKNNYCIENNITLIRIPYTERDNIDLEMLLGDKYIYQETQGIEEGE